MLSFADDTKQTIYKYIAWVFGFGALRMRARTPNWCRITEHSLRGGSEEIHHAKVLGRVMALCEKGEGQCDWPHIPEKYWEMAIKEFFP